MRAIDADRLLKMMSHWKPYVDMDNVREAIRKAPTLTPQNEPLTCEGCYYDKIKAYVHCSGCSRDKKDLYRRPPERQEDT